MSSFLNGNEINYKFNRKHVWKIVVEYACYKNVKNCLWLFLFTQIVNYNC